jgi:hypothetical protein
MQHPAPVSKEVTLSSNKEAPSNIVTRCVQDGVTGGNKRRKQHPLGATTTCSYDDDHGGKRAALTWGALLLPHMAPGA